jgi:hypothetical protein
LFLTPTGRSGGAVFDITPVSSRAEVVKCRDFCDNKRFAVVGTQREP